MSSLPVMPPRPRFKWRKSLPPLTFIIVLLVAVVASISVLTILVTHLTII